MTPNTTNEIMTIAADLCAAEIGEILVNHSGCGEATLYANSRQYVFAIDSECNLKLDWCDEIDLDAELSGDAIDWREFNEGRLYNKIREAWLEASAGPYYDFLTGEYYDDYETEIA